MVSTPYDLIAGQFAAARVRLRADERRYLALILEPLAPGSTILDLGCGTGYPVASHLASLGHRIVGVDGSAAMLAVARGRLPQHRWMHAAIEEVAFDETFDAVICWDALFHLPREQWPVVIGRIHEWLRPHGRFMMSSGGVVDPDGHGFTDTMFGHEFYYDSLPPASLATLLDGMGFDILVGEMCDPPDGGRNRGKWATVASRRAGERGLEP